MINKMLDKMLDTPGKIADLFTEECPVPAFLLPIGSTPSDFYCVFDFKGVFSYLNRKLLVRPRIVIWSGRDDIDRNHLVSVLKDRFLSQLNKEREEKNPDPDTSVILENQKDKASSSVGSAVSGLTASLVFMLFTANPLFDLLFLLIALSAGKEGIQKSFDWLKTYLKLQKNKGDILKEREKLEKEFDSKSRVFQQAAENLHVNIHPMLNALVSDFCEIEGISFCVSSESDENTAPDVREFLKMAAYRESVQKWLLPVLDAHADCLEKGKTG